MKQPQNCSNPYFKKRKPRNSLENFLRLILCSKIQVSQSLPYVHVHFAFKSGSRRFTARFCSFFKLFLGALAGLSSAQEWFPVNVWDAKLKIDLILQMRFPKPQKSQDRK